MIIVITAFVMIVAMGVFAIIKLEDEKRAEQFARLSSRRNARLLD